MLKLICSLGLLSIGKDSKQLSNKYFRAHIPN